MGRKRTKKPLDTATQEALDNLQCLLQEQVDHLAGVPEEGYKKPLNYVYTVDGAYEVRVTSFATFIAKANRIKGVSQRKIHPGVEFKYGKIPFRLLLRALNFFRLAYKERKGEALYMIFFDPAAKEYVEYVPRQFDGPAHAREADATQRPAGCTLVAHIHSHPNFGGRFSGIDNNDDRRCSDAAIFGVLGHINRDVPEMQWRASVGGEYVEGDVFDFFTSPFSVTDLGETEVPREWLDRIESPPEERRTAVFFPPAAVPYNEEDAWQQQSFWF